MKRREFHSLTHTSEYRIWASMIQRCCNPKDRGYHLYGGRGITVCEQWKNSFTAFIEDVGRRPSSEYSLDRKDNNKGYEPSNCKWATKEEQRSNQRHIIPRNARFITVNEITDTIAGWGRRLGATDGYQLVLNRIKHGWTEEDAVLTPIGKPKGTRT